ncbi:MAG: right-handed parallel beta-helix repeat-containing protein [Opitutae bacterium]
MGVRAAILALILLLPAGLDAGLFEVGPGKALATPGEIQWESINPGDIIHIHWREKPYLNKWVLCRQGTEKKPIHILGISGPEGQQPVIDAENAKTPEPLDYWGDQRSLIKIGGANKPPDTEPAHIIIENLELRGARKGRYYSDAKGRLKEYASNAARLYIEKGHHITVRGCTIHDSGNGLVTSHKSRDILVESCHIYGNGNPGSIYHHNVYTESLRITFRNNRLCALAPGAKGNNLKDRSAGLKVLNNTIYGGNKQLDLVDAEGSPLLRDHPEYSKAIVDGNLIIEPAEDGNRQIVHFGGDSGRKEWYRRTLIFRNNQILTYRKDATVLFRLNDRKQYVICENNRFLHADGPDAGNWEILTRFGNIEFRKPNHIQGRWKPTGYKLSIHKLFNPSNLQPLGTIDALEKTPTNEARLPCQHSKTNRID